jgi:hypothetical protein
MTIDSLETILLTCIFIVPGFLIDGIVNAFSPYGKRKEYVYFLYCLFYSVLHYAVFGWAYILIWKILAWRLLIILGITLIGAIFLGVVIGLFKSRTWLRKLLNFLKCNISNPIPSAWDYLFSKQKSCFIIVTLNDGQIVYGLYSTNSFSSSDCDERDIYIEKIYSIDENNVWIDDSKSLGIYLAYSQIKTIEFLEGGNENATEE